MSGTQSPVTQEGYFVQRPSSQRHGSESSDQELSLGPPQQRVPSANPGYQLPPSGYQAPYNNNGYQRPQSGSSYQRPMNNFNNQYPQYNNYQPYPPGNPRSVSAAGSQRSLQDVNLDVSRLSTGSGASASTLRLGGIDYTVGDRIGSSGLFVIGHPTEPQSKKNLSVSQPSISASHMSQGPLVPVLNIKGYTSKGYSFEWWNWSAIRFTLFILVLVGLIGLLAATIGLSATQTKACSAHFQWYQGAVVYQVPVGLFKDSNGDDVGDLEGFRFNIEYLKSLGVQVLLFSYMLPSALPTWDQNIGYKTVDPRLGTHAEVTEILKMLDKEKIHVILQLDLAHTSTGHPWFVDSQDNNGYYGNYYVWRNRPDFNVKYGNWSHSQIRGKYYLNNYSSLKPMVNWTNPQTYHEMGQIMDLWLRLGVDGFYIQDIRHMHVNETRTHLRILSQWREVLNKFSTYDNRKVLMVDADYLNSVRVMDIELYNSIVDVVDLVNVEVSFETPNSTYALEAAIDRGLEWQQTKMDPWVMWTLVNMSRVDTRYVDALEAFMMTVPGTPSLIAGQEVGNYLLETKDPEPMTWSNQGQPYLSGSPITAMNIQSLSKIINARNEEFALRKDSLPSASNEKEFNKIYHYQDRDTLFMERYYGRSDAFYYMGNMGLEPSKHDWSSNAPWGIMVANTEEETDEERIELKEVKLSIGQAIVIRIKK